MALSDIIERVKSSLNMRDDTADKRTFMLREINRAAKQLWESNDLVLALKEQYFSFPTDDSQVTLPWYVGELRGVRRPSIDPRDPIKLHDMRPRYHYNSWGDTGLNTFRVKQISPLARLIENPLPLSVIVDEAQASAVTIRITGETDLAASATEIITLTSGTLEAAFTKLFINIRSIRKSVVTSADVIIQDSASTVLSVIPNMLYEPRYLLVNITESGCFVHAAVSSCFAVEVLYKPTYIPFINDYDTFNVDNYDEEIALLTQANNVGTGEKRQTILDDVTRMVNNKMESHTRGLQVPMNMAPDPFMRHYENMFESRLDYGILQGR